MKGNPDVLAALESALAEQRHANLQFRSDQLSLKKLGAKRTSKKFHDFGDESHKFYKLLTKRILLLDGDPSGAVAPIAEADSLTAVLQNALAMETKSCTAYEQAIQIAMKAYDDGTRNLFEHLIKWIQKIINWLEIQLAIIKKIGEDDYLAEML
jgi:bacterioferritin